MHLAHKVEVCAAWRRRDERDPLGASIWTVEGATLALVSWKGRIKNLGPRRVYDVKMRN